MTRVRAVVVAWTISLAAGLVACGGDSSVAVKIRASAVDSADQVMFGARSLITRDGVVRAELFADTALFFDDNTRIEMRGVTTHFHNAIGEANTVLTSRYGTMNTRLNRMQARGQVDVKSKDGRRLQTLLLNYDQLRNVIFGDSAFVLTQPGGRRLEGVGFISDPDMRNVQVLHATSGAAGVIHDKAPADGGAAVPQPAAASPAPGAMRPVRGAFTLPSKKP